MTPEEWTAVRLSLLVATTATLASLPFGIAVAWLLARRSFWGKSLLDTLVNLPLILPPVVTGYLLLISFGRRAPIGAPGYRAIILAHMIRKKLDAEGLSVSLCLGFGFEGLDFVSDALVGFATLPFGFGRHWLVDVACRQV